MFMAFMIADCLLSSDSINGVCELSICISSGMGLNAYFTYTVVFQMGYGKWP